MIDIPIDHAMNWVGGVESPYAAGNLIGQGGIPSIMRSTSGVITQLRQEHTWVEAYVDFEPSRGIKLHNLDSWVPMDASFKQYDFTPGYDLESNVPFDPQPLIDEINATATINEDEGWVQNVPQQAVEDQLTQFQAQLETYITNQNPEATVGDVLGLKTLKIIPPNPCRRACPIHWYSNNSITAKCLIACATSSSTTCPLPMAGATPPAACSASAKTPSNWPVKNWRCPTVPPPKTTRPLSKATCPNPTPSLARLTPANCPTRWLWTYNNERPNMGLGGITPIQKLALAA